MKISVITVVYNNEATISDAVLSVLSQRNIDLEYIIVDGGSSDNTLELIKQHIGRIDHLISEADNGLYDAMNKGIAAASGDIIGILNSDDVYSDPFVIRDVLKQFEERHDLDIVYGNLVYVKSNNLNTIVRKWKSKPYYKSFFENGNVAPHPTVFLRNKVYKRVGSFDLEYTLAADYEFLLRIFKTHGFTSLYLDRLMVRMRLGGATNKNLMNIFIANKEVLKAWKKHGLKAPMLLMPLRIIKRLMQYV